MLDCYRNTRVVKMTPKSFAAALLGIALILLAVVVVIIPASALGQCGEGDCGKIVKSDCATSERCVEKWGGYYCVDDPACSSAPSATGTPTAVTTTTATPAPSATGSSCSSAGGVCRYYTGFYCYSGEGDVGKKDCGFGQTCCKKAAAAPKVTPTKTPASTSVPTKTPTSIPSTTTTCGDSWCGTLSRSCQPTEKCVSTKLAWFFRSYNCVEDPACGGGGGGAPPACGNGICETGTGKESYLNCPADCPKPISYYYKTQPNITSTVSKCPDGTPRFTCSNSTPGKYCDGLAKLVTLARCSTAPTPAPTATETSSKLQKGQLGCGGSCGILTTCKRITQRCVTLSAAPGSSVCRYDAMCARLADLQTRTITKVLSLGFVKNDVEYVGDYDVTIKSVDTTSKTALVKVLGPLPAEQLPKQPSETKIIPEGSNYRFFSGDVGGGVEVKVNIVMKDAAELTITYKD